MPTQFPLVTIPHTEVRPLTSTIVPQEYRIFVAFPEDYQTSEVRYPVLYVLDANGVFGMVTEAFRMLKLFQELPETLIVGIGYPVNGYRESQGLRIRDLTPTEDDDYLAGIVKIRSGDFETGGTGGANHFLEFVRTELQPFIQANYRTDPGDSTILGYSFGGLFGLYNLFHAPDMFNRYIIGSPAIWWDSEAVFSYEEHYASEHTDLTARVFMSAGSLEENKPISVRGGPCAYVSNMQLMASHLRGRGYPGLELKTHVFADENHLSNIPGTISRGLRFAYGAL